MVNEIIIAIVMVVVFLALRYIVKERARGRKCIGCPSSGSCAKCSCSENAVIEP